MEAAAYKTQEEFGQFIRLHFARQDIPEQAVVSGMLTLTVLRAALLRILQFLRDDPVCRFTQLTDITCVHYPDRADCFSLVYHLLSPMMGRRLRIKLATQEDVPVSSVTAVFANAAWYEREIREMFGVSFEGHPDLRRLLTQDETFFFPLRKTFPAAGKVRLVYDQAKGQCVYVPCAKPEKESDVRLDRKMS
ncbi:MAG: NADH-quinone oxidoreductase subunit C [Alphaproteobacteria bacterium]|nr:NADH-quinone oxidoreductase subunit C [Alphaproteobacteria bacterium]